MRIRTKVVIGLTAAVLAQVCAVALAGAALTGCAVKPRRSK